MLGSLSLAVCTREVLGSSTLAGSLEFARGGEAEDPHQAGGLTQAAADR